MLTRAWILDILTRLPLWYWPIFFWEVAAFERYVRAFRAANPAGILGVGVTRRGRLVITLQATGDSPAEPDWTGLFTRAPWTRLAPGESAGVLVSLLRLAPETVEPCAASDTYASIAQAFEALPLKPG